MQFVYVGHILQQQQQQHVYVRVRRFLVISSTCSRCILCFVVFFPVRARRGLGGDHHPAPRQRSLRLPVRHHPQRQAVRRVDLPPPQAGLSHSQLGSL